VTPPVRVGTAEAPDGAVLCWRAEGTGPALLCSNGIGISTFFWRRLAQHFAPTHTVVTWDYRGHGRTPVPEHPEGVTVAQCARDLWTVAERIGAGEAVLLGHSMGAQVSLEAYRLRPGGVRALVPVLGAAGGVFSSFLRGTALTPLFTFLLEVAARNASLAEKGLRAALQLPFVWEAFRALGMVHPDLCPREEFEPYFQHLSQLDLRAYFALARDPGPHAGHRGRARSLHAGGALARAGGADSRSRAAGRARRHARGPRRAARAHLAGGREVPPPPRSRLRASAIFAGT